MKKALIALCISMFLALIPIQTKALSFHLFTSVTDDSSYLIGKWVVYSKVIWSDCPYVKKGAEAKSMIRIKDINGTLFPEWEANDWQLVRNKTIDFGMNNSLHWERESKLADDNKYWFVRSSNDFDFSTEGKWTGRSVHDQYLNGKYVGSYETVSYLTKL